MQMWHLTQEVTVTGDNGGGQAAAGTSLPPPLVPTRLIREVREDLTTDPSPAVYLSLSTRSLSLHPSRLVSGLKPVGNIEIPLVLSVRELCLHAVVLYPHPHSITLSPR